MLDQALPLPSPDELERIRIEVESLCRECAPADLAGRNFYLIWEHELTGCESTLRGGCTHSTLDLMGKPRLGERWKGRGHAICLAAHGLYKSADEISKSTGLPIMPQFEKFVYAVALHEAAHNFAEGYQYLDVSEPLEKLFAEKYAPQILNFLVTPDPEAATDPKTLKDHDSKWIRCCIHLFSRAARPSAKHWALLCMALGTICETEVYGLSDIYKYCNALGDEPDRMIDATFPEILTTAPPKEFTDLYAADCAKRAAKSQTTQPERTIV